MASFLGCSNVQTLLRLCISALHIKLSFPWGVSAVKSAIIGLSKWGWTALLSKCVPGLKLTTNLDKILAVVSCESYSQAQIFRGRN